MASDRHSGMGEFLPSSSDSISQKRAKLRRRRVKREGSPQLQFLIATDPSQFRDEHTKRSVRSQAMIHWRHEEDKIKRKGGQTGKLIPLSSAKNATQDGTVTSPIPTRTRQLKSLQDAPNPEPSNPPHQMQQDSSSIIGSNSSNNSTDYGHLVAGASHWQLAATETASYFPKHQRRIKDIKDSFVIDYEESEKHEERQLRTLVVGLATFYNMGGCQDPFDVLPQFRNPQLDSLYLSRSCMRAFTSDSTMEKWLPFMLSHPHIILSSTVLASTWLDMHNKCSGDSSRTAMVKAETMGMINERLNNPTSQLDDATLIVILHLFAGEMWRCNEKILRVHENGIATLINRRGGLVSFTHNRAVAEVATACCYHCDIICETEVLPPFRDGLPASFISLDSATVLPESPLFCPRQTYFTIPNDVQCSRSTLELLIDMKDLTNMFVAYNSALNTVHDVDALDVMHLIPPSNDYETKLHAIRMRVASLPSAQTSGELISGDWVYESCRIAALIYTTAIAMGVPFSVAADPSWIESLGKSACLNDSNYEGSFHKGHLTETLYETLQRANTSDVWKNMSGVLYWVSAVGAAAARMPSTLDMEQHVKLGHEAYSAWVRRCLIMTATRTMIVLVFEHPLAITTAQKTLLKVQELIGSYASRRLMT